MKNISDTTRLNFMEKHWNNGLRWAVIHTYPSNGFGVATDSEDMHTAMGRERSFKTIREAIDTEIYKAMKEDKNP